MKIARFLVLVVGCWLGGCGRDGGQTSGVDGNTNYLEGILLRPDDRTPLDFLQVDLLEENGAHWNKTDSAITDSTGHFAFLKTSPGSFRLESYLGRTAVYEKVIVYDPEQGLDLGIQQGFVLDSGALWIEDFSIQNQVLLQRWFEDALPWEVTIQSADAVSLQPTDVGDNLWNAVEDCGTGNPCLHVIAQVSEAWAATLWSLRIANGLRGEDASALALSGADTLVVRAKGNGTLGMEYQARQQPPEEIPGFSVSQQGEFSLSGEWQEYKVPLVSLDADIGGVSTSMNLLSQIAIGLVGEGELWLDDIRVLGGSPYDLR